MSQGLESLGTTHADGKKRQVCAIIRDKFAKYAILRRSHCLVKVLSKAEVLTLRRIVYVVTNFAIVH